MIEKLRRKKLSSQISITYGVILFITLIFTNIGTTAGVYYLFFHQAERAIDNSVEKVVKRVNELQAINDEFFEIDLVPSIIFRVTDERGKIYFDSNPYFPKIERMLNYIRKNPV